MAGFGNVLSGVASGIMNPTTTPVPQPKAKKIKAKGIGNPYVLAALQGILSPQQSQAPAAQKPATLQERYRPTWAYGR